MQISSLMFERSKYIKQNRLMKLMVFICLSFLVIILFGNNDIQEITNRKGDYVALLRIDGVIDDDFKRDKTMDSLCKDDSAKALVLSVNSPGGTTVAAEKLYLQIEKLKQKKPVAVVMGTVAASGGYLSVISADRVFAHHTTITGSIGVLMQSMEATELAEKIGIKFENFKTSPLKAAPNMAEKTTPEVREAIMSSLNSAYEYFIHTVAKERKMDIKEVRKLADGRVYTGIQALDHKLIDQIGTTDDALEWLKKEKQIDADLELKEVGKDKYDVFDEFLEDFQSKISARIHKSLQSVSFGLIS